MKFALLLCILLAYFLPAKEVNPLSNPTLNPIEAQAFPHLGQCILLSNGKADFVIVADTEAEKSSIPNRRSVTKAVEVIQDAFRKCANVEIPVLSPDQIEPNKHPRIMSIGDNRFTRSLGIDTSTMNKQGFTVQVTSKMVAIAGYDGSTIPGSYTAYDWSRIRYNGTLNGAYDFVERFLGVRFYYPGIGTIYPSCKRLVLPTLSYKDAPYFVNRFSHVTAQAQNINNFYPEMHATSSEDWEGRYRQARGDGYWASHAPAIKLLDKKYPDKIHTIHYRAPNGYLYYNPDEYADNYMDLTNLRLADLLLKELNAHYTSNGRDQSVWMNCQANLTNVAFGQCETFVQNMDNATIQKYNLIPEEIRGNPRQELSNVFARFVFYFAHKLKEGYPGRRLTIIPHQNYKLPPTLPEYKVFPDNVDICACLTKYPAFAPNKEIRRQQTALLEDYYNMLGRRPVSSLWIYNPNNNFPARAISGRYIGDIVHASGNYLGKTEIMFDYQGGHEWEYFYTYYLVWRCLWNPDFNVDAALIEMWQLLYGDAATFIQTFYNTVREHYELFANGTPLPKAFDQTTIEHLKQLLVKADAAVPPNSLEAQRLILFKRPWENALQTAKKLQTATKQQYSLEKIAQSPNVNGMADEDFWKNIPAISLLNNDSPANTTNAPSIKLAYNDDGIYGLLSSSNPPMANDSYSLWNNCHLEVFLSPGMSGIQYYYFAFDATEQCFAGKRILLPSPLPLTKIQHSKCSTKSQVNDAGWTMEFVIPWDDLAPLSAKDTKLFQGNLILNRKQPKEERFSFSLSPDDFHEPKYYGLLNLK